MASPVSANISLSNWLSRNPKIERATNGLAMGSRTRDGRRERFFHGRDAARLAAHDRQPRNA